MTAENHLSYGQWDPALDPAMLGFSCLHTPKAFKYLIYSIPNRQVLYGSEYFFPFVRSWEDYLPALRRTLIRDELTSLPYQQFYCFTDAPVEIVPAGMGTDSTSMQAGYAEELMQDEIEFLPYKAFWLQPLLLRQSMENQNARCRFRHPLLRLYQAMNTQAAEGILCQVWDGEAELAGWNSAGLKQYKRFRFGQAEDFLYHLTLFTQSIEIPREQARVFLCGELDINSGIYTLCYPYFRELIFGEPSPAVRFSPGLEQFSKSRILALTTSVL
jgi:hypothetical protein